jgi:hypothetical protein
MISHEMFSRDPSGVAMEIGFAAAHAPCAAAA